MFGFFSYICIVIINQLKLIAMEKDNFVTEVIFRKYKSDDIIALFPYEVENFSGDISSYMHVGQHGIAEYNHVIKNTKLATEEEYKVLKHELENEFGYNLKVIRKRNYNKYIQNYNNRNINLMD